MTIYAIGGGSYTPPQQPAPKPATYQVKAGDSLESIAQANHTTVQALAQLNQLDLDHPHAVVIRPGQELQLPAPSDDSDTAASDPVVQALNNYEQVATSTRNSEYIAAHSGNNPGDPGLQLNLDQAQTKLNQALEFQAAANQRAGAAPDANEINSLVQHYGALASFANNGSAQTGLNQAASTLNAPQATSVDQIFSQVSAPSADNSNLGTRENQFANALAGQPPDVVAAVRNDPRYQPLLNQFVDATVSSSANLPPQGSGTGAVANWENQAQQNLSDLADMVNGRPGLYNGLPPSIAADIVKLPQTQQLISNVLTSTLPPGAQAGAAGQQQLQTWLGRNFQSMSRIADSLGSNTPAATQFTQQTAQQIVGALQAANVPPSAYSQYLNLTAELGAPPTDINTQASPALAIAIAQQVQAGGDSKDAQGIINDVCSAVNNVATSSGSYTTSVTQALSDYQSKTADLNWLVSNFGANASQQQLNTAVQNYINQQGPAWQSAYKQDQITLQNSGQFLANDITQLENLPPGLKSSQVDSTLKSLAGNSSVQQALGFALQRNPTAVLGTDGSQANALLQFLGTAKTLGGGVTGGSSLAGAIAQTYMQTQYQPQLLASLSGLTPGTPQFSQAVRNSLESFVQQHPTMASLTGINEENITKLSQLFQPGAAGEDMEATVTGNLKQFASNAQPMTKSLALTLSTFGLLKDSITAYNSPSAGNVFSACCDALGLSKSVAGTVFNNASPSNPFLKSIAAFGDGSNAMGQLTGKLLNSVGLITNLQSLGSDLSGGNTVGTVSVGMNLAASGLKSDTVESALMALGARGIITDSAASFLDPIAGALMWGSSLISVGQLFFSGGAHPPSITTQQSFLKDLGYGGLSQNAQWDLLAQTSNNPSLSTPGSSPLMLLTKYAQDKGYNLQNADQRNAFVNWVNQLAATPDANALSGAHTINGQTPNQLDSLVQNLNAELDYSKGNISNFAATNAASDQNFNQAMSQTGRFSDVANLGGVDGVQDNAYAVGNNDHVITVAPRSGDIGVIAPQSAYQIDQLLKVIGADQLPAA
ncbi:LysM peptidoglycan-binding domain-containing protein [Dyella acidiphila]|uniref:LysM peptidoglycan-binding domain-containing protein n=1 Tax=Dyella acidiphila TaxID=2775866 RepID=A0ABR9GBI3_9GAMM|nr:LysM peptidoglycan-binding domain-containing protein [Dyella acidiphila]MBE1161407.1 LysM peptidoglycan-binding domain-containing protein [Dyella acidiphila]